MKPIFLYAVPILVLNLSTAPLALAAKSEIKEISISKDTISQYETLEITASLPSQHKNPYDYEEVDVAANIKTPDGQTSIVPAFYSGQESLWKVLYTPTKTGTFSYHLTLKTPSGIYNSSTRQFKVLPNGKDGFLRKSSNNPFYLVFDSGKPFFGIGHNIGWVTNNNISAYEKYFISFEKNGCNLTRIWTNSPWTFRIEDKNICCYNAADPEKLDALIQLAEKYGIYIVLSLDTYGALMDEQGFWSEQFWKTNPYNKANGGPCEKPWDFFTDKKAKRYYKNRLKYIVARWSHSPNIVAFELWNEVNAPTDWVKEMSSYIKSINPHGQLITISLGYPWGNNFDESSIWGLNEIDIIERHLYGNTARDVIENLISINRELTKKYSKLLFVGEFGMDSSKSDAEIDSAGDGVALHNSLWASVFTRSFATSLNWWWAEYIKRKDLYFHYKALNNFVKGVNWNSPRVEYIETTPVKNIQNEPSPAYSDVTISTSDAWGDTTYKEFAIYNNGDLSGGVVNKYLHGTQKKEFKIEPIFHADYPTDGKFILHIDMVSQGANLIIYVDGNEAFSKALPAGPGEGPWKRSLYRKDYKIYQCVYDTTFEIDVPKGEHVIQLSNTGMDWISLRKIILTNYKISAFANVRLLGLLIGDEMLFWIQNKAYNWKDVKRGLQPKIINGASFTVKNAEDGMYEVEWWDTFKGEAFSYEKIAAKNKELEVSLPDFSKDIACKIIRLRR